MQLAATLQITRAATIDGRGAASGQAASIWSVPATFGWLLLSLVAQLASIGAASILYRIWHSSGGALPFSFAGNRSFLLSVHITIELVLLGVVVLAVRQSGVRITDYLALTAPRRGYMLASAAALFTPLFVGLIALPALGLQLTNGMHALGPMAPATTTVIILRWISVGLLAPLWEEALIRGFLHRALAASRLGAPGAVVITAVIWALMHLGTGRTWAGIAEMTFAGLCYGWLRCHTSSLLPAVAVHAANNLLMLGAIAILW